MPHTGVPAEELPVRFCKVRNDIPAREREDSAGFLRGIPFHAVSGRDRAKLSCVVEQLAVRRVT